MQFPEYRPRRLRKTGQLRRMVRETRLSVDQLVCPMFVVEGSGIRRPIEPMPGIFHLSIDELVRECKEVAELQIPAVILFGIPDRKDEVGSTAFDREGICLLYTSPSPRELSTARMPSSA